MISLLALPVVVLSLTITICSVFGCNSEHQRDGTWQIERLYHAGEAMLSGQHLIVEEVYSAKNDWSAGKQLVSVVEQELESIVIRANDNVKMAIAISDSCIVPSILPGAIFVGACFLVSM